MGFQTIRKINKPLEDRIKQLKAKKHSVKVGVFGAAGQAKEEGGKTVAFIAQIHEFGAPDANIPERSFMRSTVTEQKKKITEEQRKLMDAYLKGTVTIEKALAILGESIVSKIKRKIREGIAPPWAESTLRRKSKKGIVAVVPLIDTGQLINSIGYEVE